MAGKFSTASKIIISLIVLVAIITAAYYLIGWLSQPSSPVAKPNPTPISLGPDWVGNTVRVILGMPSNPLGLTLEDLALYLAVFIILLFAFSEITTLFTVFSETTSWVISAALVIISGLVGITNWIAHIFAGVAVLGAIGIGIIMLTGILAAVTLHMGIGMGLRRWRMERQIEIEAMKSGKGAASVSSAIRGLKKVDTAFGGTGTLKP